MKKFISLFIAVLIIISAFTVAPINAVENNTEISAPQFVTENQLYALGTAGSKEAWQQWSSYEKGLYCEVGVKYFFLPENTDANYLTVYNSYNTTVTMNGVAISENSAGTVPYIKGEKATAVCGDNTYTYIVLVSSSDASIYVNDTTNSYTTDSGEHFTDFYEFLINDKENSVKGSDIAIITDQGLTETTLKKFKGRGNTNWKNSDKKQFNLTFNDTMDIAGLSGKKFSLINNERDGAVVRGKLVFDIANEVGLPYSTDTRYIDLYINGSYRGCFQISKKVEMDKKELIALEDTSEDEGVVDNFNFAVEIDIWNAGNDTHFTSKYGQTIALNTPELEDYDSSDPVQQAQMTFIQNKYAEFENALYKGTMSDLEKICDINSLAKAYLIQEWTKNCDGGLTSTYYTYKADIDKFIAVPVWDFDSGLGNVDCNRSGADISTVYPNGWLTRYIKNDNGRSRYVNTLGQAFNISGTTSENKTFIDYVKETWKNDFIPAIKVAVGQAESTSDRLKSIDEYISQYKDAFYNNYVNWGFAWGPEKGMGVSYAYSYQGQVDYLRAWTVARTNWMTTELLGTTGELLEVPELPTEPPTQPTQLEENASFYLAGTLNGVTDWFTRDYPLTFNENKTKASIDLTLYEGVTYRFKVVKVINNENRDYYVADYDAGVTSQYFFADTSSQNLNVKAKHDKTVELTLVFDVAKGLFTAYHKGEVPTEAPTTEPTEAPTIEPTEAPTVEPTDAPTDPTEAPTNTTQGTTSPAWETNIVNTGGYNDLTVKMCEIITSSHSDCRTVDCVFDSNNVCTIEIYQCYDFSLCDGNSNVLFYSLSENIRGKYISTKTFSVYNSLEELQNAESVIHPTETKEPTEAPTQPTTKAPVLKLKATKLTAGKTTTASVTNKNGKTVTYSSSKPKIAKVDKKTGKITALQAGTTYIKAKIGSVTKQVKLTVKLNPALKKGSKLVKNNSTITVKKGNKITLTAIRKATAIKTTVTNSKNKIAKAKVSKTKITITGKQKGTTTLKIKLNGVKTYKIKIKVK